MSESQQNVVLALDIGSNSIGSAWIDLGSGELTAGVSTFPAGVDETDDKRGEPKNAKRRMTRRTRITLRRRAERKRALRAALIDAGLLPRDAAELKSLLESTDPWDLRRRGLDEPLTPFEFGRVLLHLSQRRGALGVTLSDPEDPNADTDDGKVRAAIGFVRDRMLARKARTFGEFIAGVRAERVVPLTSADRRAPNERRGPREYRLAVRNKRGTYEYCADRAMIRDEFSLLWEAQVRLRDPADRRGSAGSLLTESLRESLDSPRQDDTWRHQGLLFGQRRQSWDLGVLGRCVLEPSERCVPHADMYASRYLVVETLNNLKVIELGVTRPITPEERAKLDDFLSGPLGTQKPKAARKLKRSDSGAATSSLPVQVPKRSVSVTDLRNVLGWGRPSKNSPLRFNIEADEDRTINTDWFHREIVHGVFSPARWESAGERFHEGVNRLLLKLKPEEESDEALLRTAALGWMKLNPVESEALVAAWRGRPNPDARRLKMSRKAVRNVLALMDRPEPWPEPARPGAGGDRAPYRWLTQVEARRMIAEDGNFIDRTTRRPLDEHTRRRYATGAKGLTARDRHYLKRHGSDETPTLPPAPMILNPVVRRSIHEVRRHVLEYMRRFGCRPEQVYIELSREARMGAKDADRALARNRRRDRIKREIIEEYNLGALTPNQQRAAVERVVLCVQQGGLCPLCQQDAEPTRITERDAAEGGSCELAHILPRASGGDNGFRNIVLAHRACNREMGRRTPREFFDRSGGPGAEAGLAWIERLYSSLKRPKYSELKAASGEELWRCYFDARDDQAKIAQFAKRITDIQDMTARQDAATKYAARQVMTYLADALYEGRGLPERSTGSDQRRIFNNTGLWTSRFRREWGLFFDRHEFKVKGLSNPEEHARRQKDRGDHRHHAIDAVVIGLCSRSVQIAWERRDEEAARAGVNTADQSALDVYYRQHPLDPPPPFKTREELREAVRRAVFGAGGPGELDKPVSHRPVKRKLVGALHEETLFGPVLDAEGKPSSFFTARKRVSDLSPNHLRMPEGWDELESRLHAPDITAARAAAIKRELSRMPDPPPGKSGIVRDRTLRRRIRGCLRAAGLDPDGFTKGQLSKLLERPIPGEASRAGDRPHEPALNLGVPVRSVVLLRTMTDPVVLDRRVPDPISGRVAVDSDPASRRAYVGGNNHHIEIRVSTNAHGKELWTGEIISQFQAAQRKLAKLRAFRSAKPPIPKPKDFRALSRKERSRLTPTLRAIEAAHPIVDRADNPDKGGRFVMSLAEGETLLIKHKTTGELGYFVVAKLEKPNRIILVPHWDARPATERKDSTGTVIPHSNREQFSIVPSDLKALAPSARPCAVKVAVSPLGEVRELERD